MFERRNEIENDAVDRIQALFGRTDDYAGNRIIGGMHYPNDLESGRRAGRQR